MSSLAALSSWYVFIGILVSIYHAYRGFMNQWIFAAQQQHQLEKGIRKWSKSEIVVIRCIEDMLFHFLCSLAGFLALFVANQLYESVAAGQSIEAGRAILISFCFLVGVIGIAGQLPPLVQSGKLPTLK